MCTELVGRMTDEIEMTEIEDFLASPIVKWFVSCLHGNVDRTGRRLTYDDLIDGVLLYDVFLQMGIDGQSNDVSPTHSDPTRRSANLEILMRRIRQFYENHLGEVILRQPDLRLIVQEPKSSFREVQLILVLLLGCAVKCRNNETFVERIKSLDEDTKEAIAGYISKVMYFPEIVLAKEMLLVDDADEKYENHKLKVDQAFDEIHRINRERHDLLEQLRQSTSLIHQTSEKEINEWKSEVLMLNDQVDECKRKIASIETENKRLSSLTKSQRDALEASSEKVQQADRFNDELAAHREKLKHLTFCKQRMRDLERDNQSLKERNDELVAQLSARKAESKRKQREIDADIARLQQRCDELAVKNQTESEINSKLCEENADLERRIKLSTSMNYTLDSSFSGEADESSYQNSSICEQLSQSAQSHVLRIELENRRLETLRENSVLEGFEESSEVVRLKENLMAVNRENTQLRLLLENAKKLGVGDAESRVKMLELEKKNAERIIEELRVKYDGLHRDYQKVVEQRQLNTQSMENQPESDVEHMYLKQDFGFLFTEYQREKCKVEELTKQREKCEQELHARNAKILELDLRVKKIRDECEVLTEAKNRAELDKRMFMDYTSQILRQNRQLVHKTLEKQDQFHNIDRMKDETLNNLTKAKAKLEDKVMEHYKSLSNRRESKKRSAAVSAVKNTFVKVRRAGSEFFNTSRWSSAEDSDFGFSKTLTLDSSSRGGRFRFVREPRNKKSGDFLENFSPEDFSFDKKEEN